MNKKVLIAGYPKSGNTWIGYMLAYILGAKYIDLHDPDSKPTNHKPTLELISGQLSHKSEYTKVCKTHERYRYTDDPLDIGSYDRIIHIIRDARDVVVSYYFFLYYNLPIAAGNPENILSQKSWFARKYNFKKTVLNVAQEWLMHTISWQAFEGSKLIRYEDLHQNTATTLKSICNYLDIDITEDRLQAAVSNFSFDRLSGGRMPGDEHSTSFYRKGIIGDYRNHFGWIDTLIINRHCAKEMRKLGYDI